MCIRDRNNAPDGSMYITDMHRGIIQHKVYMTVYLKNKIEDRQLDTIINAGRIFRVSKNKKQSEAFNIDEKNNAELCELLRSENGWLRDRAQQLLIHRNAKDVTNTLYEISKDSKNHLAQLHALWTLEGLGELKESILLETQMDWHPKVIQTIIQLSERFSDTFSSDRWKKYMQLFNLNNKAIDVQLAFSISQQNNQENVFFPSIT